MRSEFKHKLLYTNSDLETRPVTFGELQQDEWYLIRQGAEYKFGKLILTNFGWQLEGRRVGVWNTDEIWHAYFVERD